MVFKGLLQAIKVLFCANLKLTVFFSRFVVVSKLQLC